MRVVAGYHKGKKLHGSQKSNTRPITNFAKERLFNILRNDVENKNILDLYAGTGAIGLEALSHGCNHVTFVEQNYSACKVIKKNISKLDESHKTKVVKHDVFKYLKRETKLYDIIFSAPPYCNDYYEGFMKKVDKNTSILNKNGKLIIECNKHERKDLYLQNLIKVKEFQCDDSVFEIWTKSKLN